MTIRVATKRYSKPLLPPMIHRVTDWDTGGKPASVQGEWHGRRGESGLLEIEAEPGDIVFHWVAGQLDYAQVGPFGDLDYISRNRAQTLWAENVNACAEADVDDGLTASGLLERREELEGLLLAAYRRYRRCNGDSLHPYDASELSAAGCKIDRLEAELEELR